MSTVHPTSKTCTACGESKPLSEFARDRTQKYGVRSRCKPCHSSQNNDYNRRVKDSQPDRVRAWSKANYERNKEKVIRDTIAYRREHVWHGRYWGRSKRAERLGAEIVDLTSEQWLGRMMYFDTRCAYCHEPMTEDAQDHIVPLSKGGNHTLDNVVPVCRACNASKLNHSLIEWLLKGRRDGSR